MRCDLLSYVESLDDSGCHRVRLTLSSAGELQFSSSPCPEPQFLTLPEPLSELDAEPVIIDCAAPAMDTSGPWVFHKTTRRHTYDRALEEARAAGLFDVIFSNERGEITEGCISTLFILSQGCYYTPPLRCGLLDGVMRRIVLKNQATLPVRERILSRRDLFTAEKIYLCNSVRGIIPAALQGNSAWKDPG